ncbi:transposase, partial [Pantoea sp. B9002]
NRHGKKSRGRFFYTREEANQSRLAREPWVLFTSDAELKPRTVMKLYSRRMQIEQNFRDEKSERYGMGLRSSYSRSV